MTADGAQIGHREIGGQGLAEQQTL
jgi:hypothetical protein